MKKTPTFFIAVILTALMFASLFQMIPSASAVITQTCVCNHWYIPDENTARDIMTATGLTAHWGSIYFSSVDCVFSAASGGTFSPSGVTFCKKKACDHNGNWEDVTTYAFNANWVPKNFGGGYTYPKYREYLPTYYYDGTTKAFMFSALSQQYFQNPSNPSTYWLCGSTWGTVSAG